MLIKLNMDILNCINLLVITQLRWSTDKNIRNLQLSLTILVIIQKQDKNVNSYNTCSCYKGMTMAKVSIFF